MENRKLVLFDFDGTLTNRDTMLAFVEHCRGPYRYWLGMVWLLPLFVALRAGFVSATDAKRMFLRHFLGGMERDQLEHAARTFADRIEAWMRPMGRWQLARHREDGDEVLIVSASLDLWLAPFLVAHGLRALSTKAAFTEDGRFEGELASPNCNGPEKVRRIREAVDLEAFSAITAYGDSRGDRDMLDLADNPVYRPFR
ncbi:MAG: HAD-IB family hydrolase [Myxococcota bacterium]